MSKALLCALFLVAPICAWAQDLPRSPEEVPQALERYFNAGDLNGLASLYGENSAFVSAPGTQVLGAARIRSALQRFMATGAPIRFSVRQVYRAGDMALILGDWRIEGEGRDGSPVDMRGTATDVVIRRADGSWVYAIDNPFGVAPAAR
ncbi:YybH family protein [Pseudomonas aeruginosa]|uniref:YybH family protein n=1 Tax=Pseudomonas aeruginosa TaxID=287 RepID=UPI00104D93B6|nr:nuclear transport factor 2 family protein [Pseudomonas aeruginosa]HCE6896734.1 DUF4440 domain-containing protein [Pseudomonas aeruginosa]HCE6902398.1 DUF4440 domain-containing protein [Pseudomonas aeruginosa]HCE7019484.1 DUF4440 domain-containing protein [Pseudomonas aeruginosa]HCE7063350.1 DUF4440 domain-containing protein [Pseudomonas aeruginosa]HCE7347053.1 DUF4440 domain-containing protein [Pseudomonas aeruginosa]